MLIDSEAKSVVVGPVAFGDGSGPGLLEYGGSATRTRKGGPAKRLNYRARPFMKPAGDQEAPKFKDLLKNMVR